jgi:hypothetical protein
MKRIVVREVDIERTTDLTISRIELVIDTADDTTIEIYILDEHGDRVEGGTFSRTDFMTHILNFYNQNY